MMGMTAVTVRGNWTGLRTIWRMTLRRLESNFPSEDPARHLRSSPSNLLQKVRIELRPMQTKEERMEETVSRSTVLQTGSSPSELR